MLSTTLTAGNPDLVDATGKVSTNKLQQILVSSFLGSWQQNDGSFNQTDSGSGVSSHSTCMAVSELVILILKIHTLNGQWVTLITVAIITTQLIVFPATFTVEVQTLKQQMARLLSKESPSLL
ncbi:hypothetical protein [Xylocopilactobacillus apis]|uniref:hypothetical protein n=1 Tax=Xylocopilactobacillus apis TaxID=2932183 RepID=UPI002953FC49|nr:hypothetical protein [Xylocopilactobacillus apis]